MNVINTGNYAPYVKTPHVRPTFTNISVFIPRSPFLFFFFSLLFLVICVHNVDKYPGRKKHHPAIMIICRHTKHYNNIINMTTKQSFM